MNTNIELYSVENTKTQVLHNGILYYTFDDGIHGTELWSSDGTTGNTTLVADIYPGAASSGIDHLTMVGNRLYFKASDGVNGCELFQLETNATTPLVSVVKDIVPGPAGSCPADLINVNGTLFFTAETATTGREYWKSNGTSSGTVLIKDLIPGAASIIEPETYVALNKLFAVIRTEDLGAELYVIDGTASGSFLLKDIRPGTGSGIDRELICAELNGYLYFAAGDDFRNNQIWRTDGTSTGTTQVSFVKKSNKHLSPNYLITLNNKIIFSGEDTLLGTELWYTDGTNTAMIKDIFSGLNSSSPSNFYMHNNKLFFTARDAANGEELWVSDGTVLGTTLVKDINTGIAQSRISNYAILANDLCFTARDNTNKLALWKTDGTAANTVKITDLETTEFTISVSDMASISNRIYFQMDDPDHGEELWTSDGTAGGTLRLEDLEVGPGDARPHLLITDDTQLFYRAFKTGRGIELYRATGASTPLFLGDKSDNPDPTGGVSMQSYVNYKNKALIHIHNTIVENNSSSEFDQLWLTDGTPAGTNRLDLGINIEGLREMAVSGDFFYLFIRDRDTDIYRILKSDGTASGTSVFQTYAVDEYVFILSCDQGRIFIAKGDNSETITLYYFEHSTPITSILTSTIEYINDDLKSLYTNQNQLLFSSIDYATSQISKIWVSDGTLSGTQDIHTFSDNQWIFSLEQTPEGALIFINEKTNIFNLKSAITGGTQIWKTDGTVSGTVLGHTLDATGTYTIGSTMKFESSYLYTIDQSNNSIGINLKNKAALVSGLYVTDESAALSTLLIEGTEANLIAIVDDKVYFSIYQNGQTYLGTTDGTVAGTNLLSVKIDNNFRQKSSNKKGLKIGSFAGQSLFSEGVQDCQDNGIFSINENIDAWQLIKSSTTSSSLREPSETWINLGDRMIFFLYDSSTGVEPWVIDCQCDTNQLIDDDHLNAGIYKSAQTLTATGKTSAASTTMFNAGSSVILEPNFEVRSKSALTIQIESCN